MFSIKAIAAAASLGTLRTNTGTSSKPASFQSGVGLFGTDACFLSDFCN
jgi:hypothetical protein